MNHFMKRHGKWLIINGILWCLAKQLFLAIKLWGIENTDVQRFQIPLWPLFIVVAVTGLIDGLLFGLTDIAIDARFNSLRFSLRVLLKAILNLVLGISLSLMLAPILMGWIMGKEQIHFSKDVYTAQLVILLLYFLVITIMIQFFKLTLYWMKTGDIMEIIAHPYGVEEDRIFLFLDLKASTSLAESLATTTYSRLLQESFNDMSGAAQKTGAEIYQYVGDEAVMTWKETKENFKNAVLFFYTFKKTLSSRAFQYHQEFGTVPEFKAGIHHGRVIKAQVGMMRKEIAFHGDAINTASRIQSKCNELKREVLVSESFRDQIAGIFKCQWEGQFPIRGKLNEMNLYSIDEPGIIAERNGGDQGMVKKALDVMILFYQSRANTFKPSLRRILGIPN